MCWGERQITVSFSSRFDARLQTKHLGHYRLPLHLRASLDVVETDAIHFFRILQVSIVAGWDGGHRCGGRRVLLLGNQHTTDALFVEKRLVNTNVDRKNKAADVLFHDILSELSSPAMLQGWGGGAMG